MKRYWALLLTVALSVSLLSGCGSGKKTEEPVPSAQGSAEEEVGEEPEAEPEAPTELIALPTSGQNVVQTAVTLIAGEQLGTWKNLGLDVTRTHYVSGPPQLEANPSGDWEIGWIGATAAINGVLNYDMKVIGLSGYDYSNMAFVRADSDIAAAGDCGVAGTLGTAENWKGKDILVGVGTVNYCDLMLTLDALGLTADDVNIINMDISTGYQAFITGEGDIYFPSTTYTTALQNDDAYVCVHTMEGMDAGMAGNIIANREFLDENEDVVVTYLEGALEVLLWLNDEANQEQAAEWFSQVMLDEFGVEITLEEAKANMKLVGFRDLDFYEGLCEVGSDGLTGLQREFGKFFDYHVTMGSYEADQKDTILEAVDATYLEKAIELYKANHNIQ